MNLESIFREILFETDIFDFFRLIHKCVRIVRELVKTGRTKIRSKLLGVSVLRLNPRHNIIFDFTKNIFIYLY